MKTPSRPAAVVSKVVSKKGLPRRTFLRGAGALLVAGMATRGNAQPQRAAAHSRAALPTRPNLVIILTDQERQPQYWPAGWAEANLPNRQRLADNGLTFTRAFCNSAMCSPSRSTLFTGLYPAQHGVTSTLTSGGTISPTEPVLPLDGQNLAKLLASSGYDVHYRGKWHMSKGADGSDPSSADVAAYGFQGWQPPEAGEDTNPANFGGGCANHDGRIADEAATFLGTVDPQSATPFALIVSFANPHDLLAYPKTWDQEEGACDNYASAAPACFEQGVELPPTYEESLADNYKPTAQSQTRILLAAGLGPLIGPQAPTNYINFYAYLQKVVDVHIGTVLDALAAKTGLLDKTVVIRTADHGEMGLSHGGLRQKMFNVYEETINVPLVISNPLLFPQPVQTDALASLVDLFPTLATLASVPNRSKWAFLGNDLTPILEDAATNPAAPTVEAQDTVLFTFDDENCGAANGQTTVKQPNHIRCIRQGRWKYALYFDPAGVEPSQYELYDLQADPQELHNRADPANSADYDPEQQNVMHAKLLAKLAATGTAPHNLHLPVVMS
jgi:arylsulfatase A-like enzyme